MMHTGVRLPYFLFPFGALRNSIGCRGNLKLVLSILPESTSPPKTHSGHLPLSKIPSGCQKFRRGCCIAVSRRMPHNSLRVHQPRPVVGSSGMHFASASRNHQTGKIHADIPGNTFPARLMLVPLGELQRMLSQIYFECCLKSVGGTLQKTLMRP